MSLRSAAWERGFGAARGVSISVVAKARQRGSSAARLGSGQQRGAARVRKQQRGCQSSATGQQRRAVRVCEQQRGHRGGSGIYSVAVATAVDSGIGCGVGRVGGGSEVVGCFDGEGLRRSRVGPGSTPRGFNPAVRAFGRAAGPGSTPRGAGVQPGGRTPIPQLVKKLQQK